MLRMVAIALRQVADDPLRLDPDRPQFVAVVEVSVEVAFQRPLFRLQLGWDYGAGMAWALGGLNLILLVALVMWLDRGRIVSGSVAEETV